MSFPRMLALVLTGYTVGAFSVLVGVMMAQPVELTCAEAAREIIAFRRCLQFGNSCKVSGPVAFGRYYDLKDYRRQHCGDDSGDDLRSQPQE